METERTRDRIGRIGAGLAGGFNQPFGQVGQGGLIEEESFFCMMAIAFKSRTRLRQRITRCACCTRLSFWAPERWAARKKMSIMRNLEEMPETPRLTSLLSGFRHAVAM